MRDKNDGVEVRRTECRLAENEPPKIETNLEKAMDGWSTVSTSENWWKRESACLLWRRFPFRKRLPYCLRSQEVAGLLPLSAVSTPNSETAVSCLKHFSRSTPLDYSRLPGNPRLHLLYVGCPEWAPPPGMLKSRHSSSSILVHLEKAVMVCLSLSSRFNFNVRRGPSGI